MLTSKTETLYCSGKHYKPADLRKFAISQVCSSLATRSIQFSCITSRRWIYHSAYSKTNSNFCKSICYILSFSCFSLYLLIWWKKYLQTEYVLGNNPMNMCYLVGHGSNYPQYVHHRGASIPVDAETGCHDGFKWLESLDPNPNLAVGALVGGPFLNETYIDSRNNTMQGEPSTYNSALLVGLLSGLLTSSSVVSSFSWYESPPVYEVTLTFLYNV